MKLIAFSKHFKEKTLAELVSIAHQTGLDGWDLCVRPDYPVSPENAAKALPEAVKLMTAEGLSIPMVTGSVDLLQPDHATTLPLLAAMDKAGVRFLKLGYFTFHADQQDYWQEVDKVRSTLEAWQTLSRRYNIRICYHTHSGQYMGTTGGMLAHLLRGFDPRCLGAFLDPMHLLIEGEQFSVALAIVREYLALVALKDAFIAREEINGHGRSKRVMVQAGEGMVDWTSVWSELARVGFDGLMSIHCEFAKPEDPEFMSQILKEVAFFRDQTSRIWPLQKG